jgi:hypothetical protein
LYYSSVAWGDYDNDGDLDLLLSGSADTAPISCVYRNDGGGVFTDIGAGLTGVDGGSVAWGDFDNDGDLDILLAGQGSTQPIGRVYRNDGGGVFSNINAGLTPVSVSSGAWGDYDNDGDLDILLTGVDVANWVDVSRVYRNDGGGAFTDLQAGLQGVEQGSVAWGDCDNDGALDILLTGWDRYGSGERFVARIYRSDGAPANTPPTAPSGLVAQVAGDAATFGWNASTDAQTPAAGLGYNLRVGTTPGGNEITSAMANTVSGHRRVAQLGNAQKRTSWTVRLPESLSTLYWSVQAVDGAYAGSAFAPEQTWIRPSTGGFPVCTAAGGQGGAQVVSDGAGGAIVAWQDGRSDNPGIYAHHLLAAGRVDPGWPANGRALCTAAGGQSGLQIVSDGAGGAIVVWQDARGVSPDIFAQRVLASGVVAPGWPANGQVACSAVRPQCFPVIATDGAHGAIMSWLDQRNGTFCYGDTCGDIYAQHIFASGAVDPAWPADGSAVCTVSTDKNVTIASDGAGGAIVVWGDSRFVSQPDCSPACSGYGSSIYAQHVLAVGQVDPTWPAGGRQVDMIGCCNWMVRPKVVADGAGSAVVVYEGIFMRGLDATGVIVRVVRASGEIGPPAELGDLAPAQLGVQEHPAIAPDGAGGAYVAWQSYFPDTGLRAQHALASGAVDPGWPAAGSLLCAAATQPRKPAVTADGQGGALVAWEDYRNGPTSQIYVQHVFGSGSLDPVCPVNGHNVSNGTGSVPQIVGDGAGGATVAWECGDIYAARLLGPFPTDVLASLVSADATTERVRLEWSLGSAAGVSAAVYRRTEQSDWTLMGTVTTEGTGRVIFVDHDIKSGTRYAYRLGFTENGRELFAGETWVDVPVALVFALYGSRPNPSPGALSVSLSLAVARPATLELLDVSGRRIVSREVGSLGAGSHVVKLTPGRPLPSGIYLLRLTQDGRTLTSKAGIVK